MEREQIQTADVQKVRAHVEPTMKIRKQEWTVKTDSQIFQNHMLIRRDLVSARYAGRSFQTGRDLSSI